MINGELKHLEKERVRLQEAIDQAEKDLLKSPWMQHVEQEIVIKNKKAHLRAIENRIQELRRLE